MELVLREPDRYLPVTEYLLFVASRLAEVRVMIGRERFAWINNNLIL